MYDKNIALSCAEASKLAYADSSDNSEDIFIKKGDTEVVIVKRGNIGIVAFRGTESIRDWLTDARIIKTTFCDQQIHSGFVDAYEEVRDQIRQHVRDMFMAEMDIYITGHSLGAALATITAYDLDSMGIFINAVYTYGSPRVGDAEFAASFNAIFESRSYRHINDSDLVCRMPTMLFSRHVSQAIWFKEKLEKWQMLTPPWYYGWAEIWQNVTRFKWGDSFTDHSIADYRGLLVKQSKKNVDTLTADRI